MRRVLGSCILGFVGGWLLSRMRAQAGVDLVTWPMADISSAALVRAAALAIFGLALWQVRFGLGLSTLFAIALGYAAQGLLIGPFPRPSILVIAAAVFVAVVGHRMSGRTSRDPDTDEDGAQPANLGEMLGLFVAGGGLAIALESVARHVRLFGAGLAQDDTVFGAMLLVLVAIGAAAFGWIAMRPALRRLSFPVLLGGSAVATFASIAVIDGINDTRSFDRFLRNWGLDTSYHGTLGADVLIGAACFVVPAFALGAALRAARGKRTLSSALLGAALGLTLLPRLLAQDPHGATSDVQLFSAQFVPLASLVALAGAALAILAESKRTPRARWIALAALVPLAIPALTLSAKPIFVLSPWNIHIVPAFLQFETPAGFAAIEWSPPGFKMATIDGRAVTPPTEGLDADVQRIKLAFALVPKEKRDRGLNVLLVGQMSAVRGDAMLRAGAKTIDRTAAWHVAMSRFENELFKAADGQSGMPAPPGEILALDDARKRFEHGDYDLVIALPMAGDPPRVDALKAPEKTVVVRWLSCDEPLRGVEIAEGLYLRQGVDPGTYVQSHEAVLSGSGLEHLALGLFTNATIDNRGETPCLVDLAHTSTPSPFAWLMMRKIFRVDAAHSSFAQALVAPGSAPLLLGMRAFYAAQVPSSPYETPEERIELPDAALEQFAKLGVDRPLDAFEKQLWEWLSRVLVGKRDVERLDKYVAPMAQKFAPWPALEIALAHADIEALEPEKAIARLQKITLLAPAEFGVWSALGDAHAAAKNTAGAETSWRRALELRPKDRGVRRKLAIALALAGDAEGKKMIRELLAEDRNDEELRAFSDERPLVDPVVHDQLEIDRLVH